MDPIEYVILGLLAEAALTLPASAAPVALQTAADELRQYVIDTPAPRGWVERGHTGCFRLWGES